MERDGTIKPHEIIRARWSVTLRSNSRNLEDRQGYTGTSLGLLWGGECAKVIDSRLDGHERAEITVEQVLRELAVLGFSDIGKVVRWRPELVYEELEDADNPDQPARQVLQSRVLVIDSATLPPEARLAVAEVSQTANGFRVKMHDKHAALVSIGKHLGMFTDQVQVRARYAISAEPMSAEEWKKQFVREG